MSNYTENMLTIQCNDSVTMDKIKGLIFKRDKKGQQNYTMEKLLPLPKEFSGIDGYNDYGYYWCIIMWGTKWDVIDPECTESGDTLTLYYQTACDPNTEWVKTLCKYIKWMLHYEEDRVIDINIQHDYSEIGMCYGGILNWSPGKEFKYQEYEIMEYAYLYHRDFHDYLVKIFRYEPFNPEMAKYRDFIETHVSESYV